MSTPLGNRNHGAQDRFYRPPAMRKKQSEPEKLLEKVVVTSDDLTTVTAMNTSLLQPESVCNLSNLDHFIENTTPVVQAQCFSKVYIVYTYFVCIDS